MNFKFKIEKDLESGIAFSNNKIHAGLFNLLNMACHEAINKFNGKLDWIQTFVKFQHEGKKYEQVEAKNYCEGCVFSHNICTHPYFTTKPHCTGKVYIEK